MRVSFNQFKNGFVVKINGIGIYWAGSQPEAMKAVNLIMQGKFLAVFKNLYKHQKRNNRKYAAKSNATLVLQYVAAVRGYETKRHFGNNDVFSGSPLSTAYIHGFIDELPGRL